MTGPPALTGCERIEMAEGPARFVKCGTRKTEIAVHVDAGRPALLFRNGRPASRVLFFQPAMSSGKNPARLQCHNRSKRNLCHYMELGGHRNTGRLIRHDKRRSTVGGIIYLVGLVVVILAILSFLGLR
jgi:hypothetical protein